MDVGNPLYCFIYVCVLEYFYNKKADFKKRKTVNLKVLLTIELNKMSL